MYACRVRFALLHHLMRPLSAGGAGAPSRLEAVGNFTLRHEEIDENLKHMQHRGRFPLSSGPRRLFPGFCFLRYFSILRPWCD